MKRPFARSGHIRPLALSLCAISVLVLVPTVSLAAGGQQEAAPPVPSPPAARIVFLTGEVLVDGVAAEIGDTVIPGSILVTGADGLAELTFGSGNALRVEEDTELTLDVGNPAVGLDLRRGTIAAVFEGLASVGTGPEDSFRINTPSTVAGVRGTAFFVKIESDDQTYVCTCRGILEFEETGLVVRAARHNATRFTRSADGVVATPAPDIYHDTASLNAVAEVAGVSIEWGVEPED